MIYTAPLPSLRIPANGEYGNFASFRIRAHTGVDFIAASGTPVAAVIGGTVVAVASSSALGHYLVWKGDDGLFWSYAHSNSIPPVAVGQRIETKQLVYASGALGLGITGPHLHVAVGTSPSIGVATRDPMQYLNQLGATMTPAQVKLIAAYLNARALGKTTTATKDGIPGTLYWTLIQMAGQKDGLYPSPAYTIDGKPGPKTYALEKHYLTLATPAAPTPPPVVVPPSTPIAVTRAEVETTVKAAEIRILAALAALPKSPTAEQIALAVVIENKKEGN